jgi:hypothetical protein
MAVHFLQSLTVAPSPKVAMRRGKSKGRHAVQQPVQADALRRVTPLAVRKRRAASRARLNVALAGQSMLVTPTTLDSDDGRRLSLTVGRTYEVLGIEADDYRLLSDEAASFANDPLLYPAKCFRILDANEPAFWVCTRGEDGERYAYPTEWNGRGFFERYHDRVHAVREQFWSDLRRLYPKTWQERQAAS